MTRKEVKGLFIGLNTIDIQFMVDKYPGQNEKAKAKNYGIHTGGPATNAAITYSHLGGETTLVSSFGKHTFTQKILAELNQYGINPIDMIPGRICDPVFASVVTTMGTGDRSIISYHPVNQNYCDINTDEIETDRLDILLTDSFYIEPAIALAKRVKGKIPVVMDGGSWKQNLDKLLPYVDVAICSADFLPPGTKSTNEVFKYLTQKGIDKIAITRGSKSILVKEGDELYKVAVKKTDAIDTLGAGDIFHGAFCYYYAQRKNLIYALEKASLVAAKSCRSAGTREWMK